MAAPLVLGHRGAARVAPENTVAAFRAALAAGADGVECDVRRTADGGLVCFHDAALGRTAPGEGRIQDLDASALAGIDAGRWMAPHFAGTRIPTLDEALTACASATLVVVEAKVPEGDRDLLLPSISDTLGDFLRGRAGGPPVLVASKQIHVLREIRALVPDQPLGIIVGRPLAAPEWRFVLGQRVGVVLLRGDLCTRDRIAQLHAAEHAAYAWTVNDPDRARALCDAGVAALITDDPVGIAAAVRS